MVTFAGIRRESRNYLKDMRKRHKWNGKVGTDIHGLSVFCFKCGMVKQTVSGFPTYFIDDTVRDKIAPPCDERLLNNGSEIG